MKFSSAMDFTDARKTVKFDEHIYDKTGLVYFLDLEKSELSIEFNYNKTPRTTMVGGYKRTQYFTYHEPRENSIPISSVTVRKCRTFDYFVLVTDSLEFYMEDRLRYVLRFLEQKAMEKKVPTLELLTAISSQIVSKILSQTRTVTLITTKHYFLQIIIHTIKSSC